MKIRLITRPINKIKQVILDFIHHNHIINWTPLQKKRINAYPRLCNEFQLDFMERLYFNYF